MHAETKILIHEYVDRHGDHALPEMVRVMANPSTSTRDRVRVGKAVRMLVSMAVDGYDRALDAREMRARLSRPQAPCPVLDPSARVSSSLARGGLWSGD